MRGLLVAKAQSVTAEIVVRLNKQTISFRDRPAGDPHPIRVEAGPGWQRYISKESFGNAAKLSRIDDIDHTAEGERIANNGAIWSDAGCRRIVNFALIDRPA